MALSRKYCHQCGKKVSPSVPISRRGKCPECAARNAFTALNASLAAGAVVNGKAAETVDKAVRRAARTSKTLTSDDL